MSLKEDFQKEREELNDYVMKYAGKEIKRFFSLDGQMYRKGALNKQTKELLGLVASAVLRCDDCIKYHIIQCVENGVNSEEIQEALGIAMMVGGSIVIPHVRRAFKFLDTLIDNNDIHRTEFVEMINTIRNIVSTDFSRDEKLFSVCKLLNERVDYYNWVGFYLVDKEKDKELILGPYVGTPTEHKRIAFGEGICGQAAEREISFVVQDVSKESNYLSCSKEVKSEILSPIFKEGILVGEVDIDSHIINPYTEQDRLFLEKIAEIVSDLF
ncbi:MAG TPA: carboxymuconolactone decarboxylase family protein [Thermotogota bacterium]|nr:carboxymuconolactone decarboxylase family protein [Thermotogota bacterium]HPJ87505.1 carboxymuconolactone decarboxylase family protein [Thermotogota bacterium]HPR94710.1 carboxymuconolactone decarboxylase family protein [Thermotogota bacterium]